MATETVKATDARKRLFDLMQRTSRLRSRFVLTRDGKPQSVLMSAEEFEEWVETLDLLQDRPLVKSYDRGLRDLKAGRTKAFEEVFGRKPRA